MDIISLQVDRELSVDQLSFIESSLRASFHIQSIRFDKPEMKITLAAGESPHGIRKTAKRLAFISKSIDKDTIFENDHPIAYQEDPQPYLEKSRQVIPVHPGFVTMQGDFLRVFHAINRYVKSIADELGAIEQEYPAVWPVRLFKKINYFHEFPQQVILCAPVKDDYDARVEFAERYAESESFESVAMDNLMADAEFGLEPAVCDCCYYALEGAKSLNNAFYTCYNKVFRNEKSGSGQLDRLTNFSVRDIMFVGSETFVLECRQTLIERLSRFIRDLKLHAKIGTANDPFFANDSTAKSVFQSSHRLKYELLANIPHLGREISVGSINYHTEFFGKAFDIELENGSPASSGCIGVGMERMTYALCCQHGPVLGEWPESVMDLLDL